MKNYVYVDYENMGDLKSFPKIDGAYFFFIGANQKTVPKSLVFASNENEVKWIEIEKAGRNALDFHIAYYLAKNDSEPNVFHYILSKDKGFDSLIAHVNKTKGSEYVKRIANLNDVAKGNAKNKKDDKIPQKYERYERIVKILSDLDQNNRPKSEKTLKNHIRRLLGNNPQSEAETKTIIEELYKNNVISKGRGNEISYSI